MIKFDELPAEVLNRMLELQVKQGNPRNSEVFKYCIDADSALKGFDWYKSEERYFFWEDVLLKGNLNTFYTKYPIHEEPERLKDVPKFRFPNSLSILKYAEDSSDDSLYINEGFNTTIGEVKTKAIKDLLEVMMPLTLVSKIRWAMQYMDSRVEEPFFSEEEREKIKELLNLVSIDI